jgi:hypothetical protein
MVEYSNNSQLTYGILIAILALFLSEWSFIIFPSSSYDVFQHSEVPEYVLLYHVNLTITRKIDLQNNYDINRSKEPV